MTELHIKLDRAEARELLVLLNRSLNTLDPRKWPLFASKLEDALLTYLANSRIKDDEV